MQKTIPWQQSLDLGEGRVFDQPRHRPALVTLTAIWWAIEGLGLLAIGHRLKIDSPANVRLYALSNIPALVIGVVLLIAGIAGLAFPTEPSS